MSDAWVVGKAGYGVADVVATEGFGGEANVVVRILLHTVGCAEVREGSAAAIHIAEGNAN
jgi:hypothetical protein